MLERWRCKQEHFSKDGKQYRINHQSTEQASGVSNMKRLLLLGLFAPWHASIVAGVTLFAPMHALDRWPLLRQLIHPVLMAFPSLVGQAEYYLYPQVALLTFALLLPLYALFVLVAMIACPLLLGLAERAGASTSRRINPKERRLAIWLFVAGVGSLLAHMFLDPAAGIGSGAVRTSRWALALVHFAVMWTVALCTAIQYMYLVVFIKDRFVKKRTSE